jgi:glycerol uptake facilitator-like aquaporin
LSQPYGVEISHGSLGACFPRKADAFPNQTPIGMGRAFLIEFMTSLLLCLAYFGSFYKSKHLSNETGLDSITKLFSHISIGMAMVIGSFAGLPTGGCMNPARAFASELLSMSWNINSWIYYIAPICGATFGALIYEFILTEPKKSYIRIK